MNFTIESKVKLMTKKVELQIWYLKKKYGILPKTKHKTRKYFKKEVA